ncbi:MAG: multidrug efflux RND transporter permease subunit [Betaproteobacteria bacterium]|nr:multidrug efflux RND transporter permease subunit [Betaproteobacteria bacterium]
MNISAPFIQRPVATTLVALGVVLAGIIAFFLLPAAPLPQVDFPTISVQAALPGASPETMAATVATPLERALGRIAGVTEITSSSSLGNTRITIQFDLDRDIDGAARDVQAAINASRPLLPSGLPSNPTYRKVNPADSPILILALTSHTLSRGQMYDAASTILAQRLSQVEGIGQVNVGGGALPAVRVDIDPNRLSSENIGLEDVRNAIVATNANRPKGVVEAGDRSWQVATNDQATSAAEYSPLLVRFQNGAGVRLGDLAEVSDSVQDIRNYGAANGKPAVLLILYRSPGANIIGTVDRVRSLLPHLQASIPAAIDLDVVLDRTPTIRGSLREVERTLLISVGLVLMVVLLFLRRLRDALIPSVAVPISLIGTCGVMYLCHYSLDNLSLMALTIATGFVVDDAIVVLENIVRHVEAGKKPMEAALLGAREIGFTVVSISLSLIAVFIPVLLMGGIVGRLFREFAVTLSAAILVSMIVSLTVTPTMAAHLLRPLPAKTRPTTGFSCRLARLVRALGRGYRHSLAWSLRHGALILVFLALTIALNFFLYGTIKKGFFPQQDTGRVIGNVQADQSISFQSMEQKLKDFLDIVREDPAVESVVGFTGGGQRNGAFLFMTLKPLAERKIPVTKVIGRLRGKLARVPGASLFLIPAQDVTIGGRPSNAQFQYTLQGDDLEDLRKWEPRIRNALSELPELVDVNTDQQDKGLQTSLVIDRDAASRLGLSVGAIDAVLNDAFGQRQVSIIYNPLNQYRVVLELAPRFLESPETLKIVNFTTTSGGQVPLRSFARIETTNTPLAVNHQSGFPASTISFNLPGNTALGQASAAIDKAIAERGVPSSIHGSFQGTAKAFQDSLASQPLLILAAIGAIYIVLGMLYESLIHPLTILSTLPSAGVGALLALMAFDAEFSVIALIGVLLLIGIVKKNAIMMIDFAIDRQRRFGLSAGAAIYRACLMRFRPIMMTTLAAAFGAIPLALGSGDGAELRNPLGISIVGGLLVSQVLTLYSTPIVYVVLDRLRERFARRRTAPIAPAQANSHP